MRVDALMNFVRTHDLSMPEHYAEVEKQVDLAEFIDYLILRLWSGDWDWPQNNWYGSRQREDGAKWYFHSWDAEGMLGRGLSENRVNQTGGALGSSALIAATRRAAARTASSGRGRSASA